MAERGSPHESPIEAHMTVQDLMIAKTDFIFETVRDKFCYPYEGLEKNPRGRINSAFFYGKHPYLSLLAGEDVGPIDYARSSVASFSDCFVIAMDRRTGDSSDFDTNAFQEIAIAAHSEFTDSYGSDYERWSAVKRLLFEIKIRSSGDFAPTILNKILRRIADELQGRLKSDASEPDPEQSDADPNMGDPLYHEGSIAECEIQLDSPIPESRVVGAIRQQFPKCPNNILGRALVVDPIGSHQAITVMSLRARYF